MNVMKYWEKTFPIRVSECDVNNGWRPGAILTELQEAAGHHSAAVSCSREALLALDLAWVVVRLDLRMSRYPVAIGSSPVSSRSGTAAAPSSARPPVCGC